jgi:chemotaxis protein MotA
MSKINQAEGQYYQVLRAGLIASIKGAPPALAVESARRSIPSHIRPSFKEMEAACKGGGASAPAAAA